MIAPAGLRHPRVAHFAAEVLDTLGFGGAFAPGARTGNVLTLPFEGNVLTLDPIRYARSATTLAADQVISGLGWWTVGWAHAALRLWKRFEDPDYARQILGPPMLIFGSGADRVIDLRAIERFVGRLRSARLGDDRRGRT